MEFAATTDIRDMMDIVGEVSSKIFMYEIIYPLFSAILFIYL